MIVAAGGSRRRVAPPGLLVRVTGAALALAAVACRGGARDADSRAGAAHYAESTGERRLDAAGWDTLWTRGGREGDTVVFFPFRLAGDFDRAYVLDAAAHRVVALRASDGALVWSAGGKGRGPNEFVNATALALSRSGDVLVADAAHAEVVALDRLGRVSRRVPLRGIASVLSMCELGDGSLLLTTLDPPAPVLRIDGAGAVRGRYALPWADVAQLPGLAQQAQLAPTADGYCLLALTLGRGFARFGGDGFDAPHRYVESFDLPAVEVADAATASSRRHSARLARRQIAAHDLAVVGDELAVAFEGRGEAAGRLIDIYDVGTGAYERSYVLPHASNRIARAGSAFVLLTPDGAGVMALAPRARSRASGGR